MSGSEALIWVGVCVVVPVVWGVFINRLFDLWRSVAGDDKDNVFPDYQI